MAYIGKPPSSVFSAAAKYDSFTGDGSTVAFDLANIVPAGGQNGLQVYVDNVRQEPGASNAYTLGNDDSGDLKRITFTAAPDNGAEIYVITPYEATNIKNVGDGTITTAKVDCGAITNAKVNACAAIADTKLAQITTASKVATSAISQPGSSSVYLAGDGSWGAIDTSQQDTNAFNISLLGFKMAVNEGLTVFNLVDGIVDEFNDESGTDESEGSNDIYCASGDFYQNLSYTPCQPFSAGFSMTTITEPDTSTAGTNPTQGTATMGTFTVPTDMTSASIKIWGAGGGGGGTAPGPRVGGGGGFVSGTLAVTPGQTLNISAGEGGFTAETGCTSTVPGFYNPAPFIIVGGFLGGGCNADSLGGCGPGTGGSGGGVAGIFSSSGTAPGCFSAPQVIAVAGSGGSASNDHPGGAGGGLTGDRGGPTGAEQTSAGPVGGGGGSQTQGGQAQDYQGGQTNSGAFLEGGAVTNTSPPLNARNHGAGGSGYYGGGAGSRGAPNADIAGGGGSSYYGNPNITCGATEEAGQSNGEGGGVTDPAYVAGTNESGNYNAHGEDGYVLITGTGAATSPGGSTTLVSTAFTSTSVPTTSRIVVFEENVDTPTLNTDIIASISRDGGATYTNATLSDSGYVTGSSGQRILTGQATISGQPSGQSMRWKLALANNTVKIHGVSLQWA